MNKLFKCLSTAVLGIAMAVGVGIGVTSGVKAAEIKAADIPTDPTKSFTFTKTVPEGWTSTAKTTGTNSYHKILNGEYLEGNLQSIFGSDKILDSDLKADVSGGTFGTWKGDKNCTVTIALLNSSNTVLSSNSFTKTGLGNAEGTSMGNCVVSKPNNPSDAAKIRISYSIPNSDDVLRTKIVKLYYVLTDAELTQTITASAEEAYSDESIELTTNASSATWSITSGSSYATLSTTTGKTVSLVGKGVGSVTVKAEASGYTDATKTVSFIKRPEGTYDVTFDSDGGSLNPSRISVEENKTFIFPSAGTKDHYTFSGWSSDGGATKFAVGQESPAVTANIKYTGCWQENAKYTVTYAAGDNGSGSYQEQNVYGGKYTLKAFSQLTGVSANDGYRFKNYTVIEQNYNENDEIDLAANTTITVNFEEKPKVYVLDLDGGKTHTDANASTSSVEIDSEAKFKTAFPQLNDVKVKYVSSSAFYAQSASKASTDAAKMGKNPGSGSVTFGLINSDKEYIKSLTIDAYGWSGNKCNLTISNGTETSKNIVISSYSNAYSIDLTSWNEPTQFTLTTPSSKSTGEECRLTIFAISIAYGIKQAKSPVESYTVDTNNVSLNENNLTHTIVNTILPSTAEQGVTYESSNNSVAEVSESGIITAKTIGEATITCTTIGKNDSGQSLTQIISVVVSCSLTTFIINKDSGNWPDSSTDTYSTSVSTLVSYRYRRFQVYGEFIELNKHGTSASATEPTFGNNSSYGSSIKSIVIAYENSTQAGYASLFASKDNTKSTMRQDFKIIPTGASGTLTYNFEVGNYDYFTLVNDANEYLKMSSIVVTLKNANEISAGTFIEKYMHPEISHDDKGTGKCATEGWYALAKTEYLKLDSGAKEAFNETSFSNRLSDWAKANGETFDPISGSFSESKVNSIIRNSDFSNATLVVSVVAILGISVIGGYFFIRRRKETH